MSGSHMPAYSQSIDAGSRPAETGNRPQPNQYGRGSKDVSVYPADPSVHSSGRADRRVVLEQHFLMSAADPFIKINPFSDAERVRNRHAGMMRLPQDLHAGGHLLRVLCIRIPSALIILGDLVAGFSVKIQNMFGNAKRCDRLVNSLLLFRLIRNSVPGPGMRQI